MALSCQTSPFLWSGLAMFTLYCIILDMSSCAGRCGEGYSRDTPCSCDYNCQHYMECCPDFKRVCTVGKSWEPLSPPLSRNLSSRVPCCAAFTLLPFVLLKRLSLHLPTCCRVLRLRRVSKLSGSLTVCELAQEFWFEPSKRLNRGLALWLQSH